jgi:uncharacterized metal-binding protein
MTRLPLVFACSGCSLAGRLAYDLAQEFDRRGMAEMSCLAGVGAGKSHFLKELRGREVWIIDGCAIECSLGVFKHVRGTADVHIRLHELGVKKRSEAPRGWDIERLLDAATKQVSEQRALKRRSTACVNDTTASRSWSGDPPRELSSRDQGFYESPHRTTVGGTLACHNLQNETPDRGQR